MDDYLSKPVQLAHLRAILQKWMPAPATAQLIKLATPAAVPAAISVSQKPVDVKVLEQLVGDDPAVIGEFLQDFRVSAAKIGVELRAAYEAGDTVAAGVAAHKLKSSARSVGALALGELCAEMERAGKAGDAQTLAALLPRFELELATVDKYIASLA
jgi:HPt (histidine-containing phosphotransfer) domain-containing protein